MKQEKLVLGAGMVGTCIALELQLRGHAVTLVDRRPPGQETSFGNAGVIQREAVEPYPMPRDPKTLASIAFGQSRDVKYHLTGVLSAWPQLLRYWLASAPLEHRAISRAYAALIEHSTTEHARLMALSGTESMVSRNGLRMIYRTEKALSFAVRDALRIADVYGIRFKEFGPLSLAAEEPLMRPRLAGAVHWLDSWSVDDPGLLVQRYADLFASHGGRILIGDASSLRAQGRGWQVETQDGPVDAEHAVLALGPWSDSQLRRFGLRWPLFIKRGYHRHYTGATSVKVATLDAERGYVLAPQRRGLRLTSGAELARLGSRSTPAQLVQAERAARELLDIGQAVEDEPWIGNRPCCADMKPVIGAVPGQRGLWVSCGHGHQGFTLGPACARLLADLMEFRRPFIDAEPYSPARFGC